jgi:hypothetical protein
LGPAISAELDRFVAWFRGWLPLVQKECKSV